MISTCPEQFIFKTWKKYYKTDHLFISFLSGTGNIKDKAVGVY